MVEYHPVVQELVIRLLTCVFCTLGWVCCFTVAYCSAALWRRPNGFRECTATVVCLMLWGWCCRYRPTHRLFNCISMPALYVWVYCAYVLYGLDGIPTYVCGIEHFTYLEYHDKLGYRYIRNLYVTLCHVLLQLGLYCIGILPENALVAQHGSWIRLLYAGTVCVLLSALTLSTPLPEWDSVWIIDIMHSMWVHLVYCFVYTHRTEGARPLYLNQNPLPPTYHRMALLGAILAVQLWQLYGVECYKHRVDIVVNGIRVKYDTHMDHFRTQLFVYPHLDNDVHKEYIAKDICIDNKHDGWPDMKEYLAYTYIPSPHLAKQLHLRRDILFYLMCHWMDITNDIVWKQISNMGWRDPLTILGSVYVVWNNLSMLWVSKWMPNARRGQNRNNNNNNNNINNNGPVANSIAQVLVSILPKLLSHLAYRGAAWVILYGSPGCYWGWHQACMLGIPSFCCVYTYHARANILERLLLWIPPLVMCFLMQYAHGVVHHAPYLHGVLLCIATDIYVV